MSFTRPKNPFISTLVVLAISGIFSGGNALSQTTPLPDQHRKGFGPIVEVMSNGAEPFFDADGYRIRIGLTTHVELSGALRSLAEVKANDWVKYEGTLNSAGELLASRTEFLPGIEGVKSPEKMARDAAIFDTIPPGTLLIDANGGFEGQHAKVRLADLRGPCGWHRLAADTALQNRVWRVGMRVVPKFQKQMPPDAQARIHFRFYAVNEPQIREGFGCTQGLVLIPEQVVLRLKSDDQLAAVLADEVAADLLAQILAVEPARAKMAEAAEFAAIAALLWDPAGFLGAKAAAAPITHSIQRQIEDHCGRIALALVAAAGYNPWDAPEAWRLLNPKTLPPDTSTLKYPDRSEYLLSILRLQYPSKGN